MKTYKQKSNQKKKRKNPDMMNQPTMSEKIKRITIKSDPLRQQILEYSDRNTQENISSS